MPPWIPPEADLAVRTLVALVFLTAALGTAWSHFVNTRLVIIYVYIYIYIYMYIYILYNTPPRILI